MKKFNSFDDMIEYAESSADLELMMRCRIVEQHQHDIPELAEKIRKLRDPDAQLTITTAHRSKRAACGRSESTLCQHDAREKHASAE
jgi:hypothetical protein